MYQDQWDQAEERAERIGDFKRDLAWTRSTEPSTPQLSTPSLLMAMLGDYLLKLLERCSDQQFGQDAVQFGITTGRIQLSYHLETDLQRIFAPVPGQLETENSKPETVYDQLCEAWRQECRATNEQLLESYRESGLMEEILRPLSFAQQIGRARAQTSAHELEAA